MIPLAMGNPATRKVLPQSEYKWLWGQSVKPVQKGRKLKNEKAKQFITGLERFNLLSKSISKVWVCGFEFGFFFLMT